MAGSIFVVTNRAFRKDKATGSYRLLDSPNSKGTKELRVFEASPVRDGSEDWRIDPISDRPRHRDFQAAGVEPAQGRRRYRASDLVAARLVARLKSGNKNLVAFIHGYNNTVGDALRRARRLAQRYSVEVLVFSWPANGGGDSFFETLHGKASYLADKSDARSSTDALDRALSRLQAQLTELNERVRQQAEAEAGRAEPDNLAARREHIVQRLRERACPFRLTLLAHSMGNYLLKKTLLTSDERLSAGVTFDNVILKAADTNHAEHDR